MNKEVTHRIAYYLKKVAERISIHPAKRQPRAYKYRNQRLKVYKALRLQQIEKEGYKQ
ncbi:hypothetical protein [Sutcliffiella sp. NC1]|uniref:hypothetical protein n=1 Tax=Sutcliffiella sp. NC1 TaxID=3004096 RepID=UPI0022DE0772|nr:hypothetical protein [Sutcliffiella sp. NC1]WBL16394.1 hypothetical protein O1A01_07105 [Sutcliffiella sp. NC1]